MNGCIFVKAARRFLIKYRHFVCLLLYCKHIQQYWTCNPDYLTQYLQGIANEYRLQLLCLFIVWNYMKGFIETSVLSCE